MGVMRLTNTDDATQITESDLPSGTDGSACMSTLSECQWTRSKAFRVGVKLPDCIETNKQ